MTNNSRSTQLQIMLVAIAILMSAITVTAQSGRRSPKTNPVSVPLPTPDPTPTPKPKEPPPVFVLIVGMERYSDLNENVPMMSYSSALSACADRLDRPLSVKVQSLESDMSRAQAIETAKESKDIHVVWLRLRSDITAAEATSNATDLHVEYTVFAPGNAKIVTSGRAFQGHGKGGVVAGAPPNARNSPWYREYLIRQVAERAAERILDALKLPSGATVPPLAQR